MVRVGPRWRSTDVETSNARASLEERWLRKTRPNSRDGICNGFSPGREFLQTLDGRGLLYVVLEAAEYTPPADKPKPVDGDPGHIQVCGTSGPEAGWCETKFFQTNSRADFGKTSPQNWPGDREQGFVNLKAGHKPGYPFDGVSVPDNNVLHPPAAALSLRVVDA